MEPKDFSFLETVASIYIGAMSELWTLPWYAGFIGFVFISGGTFLSCLLALAFLFTLIDPFIPDRFYPKEYLAWRDQRRATPTFSTLTLAVLLLALFFLGGGDSGDT